MDYNALHPSTRMELAAILEKDPMTACTAEESELLWEKRHFLYTRAEVRGRGRVSIGIDLLLKAHRHKPALRHGHKTTNQHWHKTTQMNTGTN